MTDSTDTTTAAKAAGIAPAIRALLDSNGLTLDELATHLTAATEPATVTSATTVAEAIEAAEAALEPGSVQTYKTYWRVLAHGIRLPKTWDDARIGRYFADLRAIDKEQHLNLQIPAGPHACPRTEDGRLVVVAGHGDKPLAAVTTFDVRLLNKWVIGNARANATGTLTAPLFPAPQPCNVSSTTHPPRPGRSRPLRVVAVRKFLVGVATLAYAH
jgi:hypothetical protein